MVSAPGTPASLFERIVDQLLYVHLNVQPAGRRVLQHDKEHVLGADDYEVGAGRAIPFDFTRRTRRRRHRIAGIGADTKTIAESKAVTGVVEVVAGDPRARADMVGRHRRE